MRRNNGEHQDATSLNAIPRTTTTLECASVPENITYQHALVEELGIFAEQFGYSVDELRELSETAIRTRWHEAYIEHVAYRANGRQPDVWTLRLGPNYVYFTVELHAVVIRGYGYDIDHEPLDDRDGGYFYCDNAWHGWGERLGGAGQSIAPIV